MRYKFCVLWVSGVMSVLCASAQTVRKDTTTQQNYKIQEVVITESKKARTVSSTAPLHILGRQEMLKTGVTDMADALHRLPGINLRDYGGAGGVKTVSVRGFGAKHTGVSYDGIMLSDSQSGEIDLSRYSLDNVDNISLTVGDNDEIFIPARNASTPATLSIQTIGVPTADTDPHLTAQLKVGSFGYISPFLRYEQNFSNKFAFSAVGEYTYADNDYPYSIKNITLTMHDRRTNSRMNSGHGELNFVWNVNPTSRVSGKAYYYDNDRQLPGQVHYYVNISKETLHDRNAFGQLMYQTFWTNGLSFKWYGKYNWYSSSYRDPLYTGGVMDADYWQREAYTAASLLYSPNEHWAFDYSADYFFNNLNSSLATDTRPYRHSILQSATAKYSTHRLNILARLLYSSYLNEAKDGEGADDMSRLSPSLSFSYKLLDEQNLYVRASYKNIFRAPTFNENYYFHYGSPDLKPESTDQFNLGVTWRAGDEQKTSWQITMDGYYNHVKDKIIAIPYNMFIWRCINVGKVRTLGAEVTAQLTHRFNERHALTWMGSYSLQDSENRTIPGSNTYGLQLAYTPKHTGSVTVSYENPWINLSLNGQGVSSRWANNEHYESTEIEGYWDTNLSAYRTFSFGKHTIEGRFDIKNLFDQQYEIVRFYPMPGRSWLLTINYKF